LALGLVRQGPPPVPAPPEPVRVHAPTPRPLRSPTRSARPLREDEPLPPLELAAADAEPHPFDARSFHLPNGLELIVVEDHNTPVIAAQASGARRTCSST
jgi:hypothetical protein